jgi:uncharacterized protein YecE (DUF72 family)
MKFYTGCPVWSFRGWVGNFYPAGTKPSEYLREYSRRVTTIEGNTTFYAVPAQKTIQQWVADTPDAFRFCPKVPKVISHEGKLSDHIEDAQKFVETMKGLGVRLGPMFLQLPPRFSPRLVSELGTFLSAWPVDVRLAVEVRHLDWFESPHDELLDGLLAEHNMARVTIDTRPIRSLQGDAILAGSTYESLLEAREQKPDVPVIPKRTSDFVFVRYIGHPELEVNRPFLEEWGNYFVSQFRTGADVYVFCHSPENRIAPTLCRELHQRVARDVNILPLPWDTEEGTTFRQDRLI